MPTLREIDGDLLALGSLLADAGGDVTDEDANAAVDKWFEELGQARDQKLDGYATLITSLTSRADLRKAEAARLTALAKTDTNVVARLKERLRWFFERHGYDRLDTKLHAFSLAKAGGKQALTIPDEDAVPASYVTYETIRVVDKDRIRRELEAGATLTFARLEERGKNVRIT